MAGGSKNHRRILGREPWSAAQKRSWGRKTRRALQLAPLFVSLDRADAIIEGAQHAVPGADTWLPLRHPPRAKGRLLWSAVARRRRLPLGLARACSSNSPHPRSLYSADCAAIFGYQ